MNHPAVPDTDPTSAPEPGGAKLSTNVKLLGVASLLNDVASEMVFPLLPQFLLTTLGGNRFHLGLIEGVADSVASLLKLWSGAWSDRAGQRTTFVISGYLITAVTRPLISVAQLPWHLFAARTVDRIGKGIRTSPRDALIADSSHESIRGRAFGFHRALDHLGAAIGPILASIFLLVLPGQLRALFLIASIPSIMVVVLLVYRLREPPPKEKQTTPPKLTLEPLDRRFRLFLASLFIFTLGNSSDAFLLVRAAEVGVPTALLPMLWCAVHVVKSSTNVLAGRLVDRIGPRPLILVSWLTYAGVYFMFGVAGTDWQMWLLFVAYAAFYALSEPAEKTMTAMLVPPERKGLAFGWFNFAKGFAALPSSLIFGWLYQSYGAGVAFSWGASLAVVAAALLTGTRPAQTTKHAQ